MGCRGYGLFFVVSGFGLTTSMLHRDASGRRTHLFEFLSSRCRRLVPPYYAALALYLIAGLVLTEVARVDAFDILAHLTLLHSLWPETISSIAGPHWSMSLIFQFYLVFPWSM